MGFLEGFAEGFAPAYLQSVKDDRDKEQTLLASGLADFKARQKAYSEAKAEDAQRIRTASSVASEFGFGQEMQGYIYQRLGNGETINQIRQDLESGKFATPDGKPITRAGMQPGTVDAQTAAAGLAPKPAAPASTGGTSRGTVITGSLIEETALAAVPGAITTSRYRNPEKNASVGGKPNSFHMKDMARDFVPPKGMSMGELHSSLKAQYGPDFDVINEGDHVHVEPSERARENGFRTSIADPRESSAAQGQADPRDTGPSEEFNQAFADIPAPAGLPSEGVDETAGELPPVSNDIVVEGAPQEETAAEAQPAKKGDGFGYDARGRAQRALVDAAGGEEVYQQILGGYTPEPVQSNVRFQPGRRSGTVPTLEQLRVMRATAQSDGDTQEVARLDGMISSVIGSQAQGDALKDRQWTRIVIPDGRGGAKFTTGYVATDATGKPTLMDEQGNRITTSGARRIDDTELSARNEVIKATEASNARYRGQLEGTISALPLVNDILTIAKRDPRVLTTTASIVGKVKSLGTEVVTAFNVAENIFANKSRNDPNATVYVTEQEIESGLRRSGFLGANESLEQRARRTFNMGNDANTLAENAKLMEAKLLLAAVRFGAMEGQSGQGFSNKDFDRFLTMVGGGSTNVNTFTTNLTDYLRGRVDAINTQARILNDPRTGLAAQFKQTYGYNPAPAVPTLNDMVSQMGGRHADALARINGQQPQRSDNAPRNNGQRNTGRNGDTKNPDVLMRDGKTYTRVGRTPQGKAVYRGSDGKNYVF